MTKSVIPFTMGIRPYSRKATNGQLAESAADFLVPGEIRDEQELAQCREQIGRFCRGATEMLDRLSACRGNVDGLLAELECSPEFERTLRALAGNVPEIGRAKSILTSFCAEVRSGVSNEGLRRSKYFARDGETVIYVSDSLNFRSVADWMGESKFTLGGREYCLVIVGSSSPENIRLTRGHPPKTVSVRR